MLWRNQAAIVLRLSRHAGALCVASVAVLVALAVLPADFLASVVARFAWVFDLLELVEVLCVAMLEKSPLV